MPVIRDRIPTVRSTDSTDTNQPTRPTDSPLPAPSGGWRPPSATTTPSQPSDGFSPARPAPIATPGLPYVRTYVGAPAKTLHAQDLRPIAERFDRVALDDGVVSTSDVNELMRSISTRRLSPEGEQAARTAFQQHAHRFTPEARVRMEAFFRREVPRLRMANPGVVSEQLSGPRTAVLSWDPPVTNADGTPLTDLAGYKIHYGNSPGTYNNVVDVKDPSAVGFVVEQLGQGTWYFAAKAYDTQGNESVFSNEASKVIQ